MAEGHQKVFVPETFHLSKRFVLVNLPEYGFGSVMTMDEMREGISRREISPDYITRQGLILLEDS